MEACECRKNVRETGDGRTTDRPPLLYGQFVSPRTGTSQHLLANTGVISSGQVTVLTSRNRETCNEHPDSLIKAENSLQGESTVSVKVGMSKLLTLSPVSRL